MRHMTITTEEESLSSASSPSSSPSSSLSSSFASNEQIRKRHHLTRLKDNSHSSSSIPREMNSPSSRSSLPSSSRHHTASSSSSSHQEHQLQGLHHPRDIMCLKFNQEHNLFACSTDSGLRVYNVDPLVVKTCLDPSEVGTISIVEMLHRSNLIAVVAGGNRQKYAENTVLVWDDALKKFVLELTFASPVLAIRFRRDKIFVVEKTRVHVFSFPSNVKKLLTIDTRDNIRGLIEVSMYQSSERQVMILPGFKTGTLQVTDLSSVSSLSSTSSSSSPVNITAHESEVACLALNNQGTRVATASLKGTLIRVFDTVKANLLVELRRGSDPATLYCINFSPDSDFLCASSDKGTVHVFALKDTHLNRRSSLARMSGILGAYGESQWALTNFTVQAECACICGFGPKNTVYAICVDGTFHKYSFTAETGKAPRLLAYDVFSDLPEDDDI